MTVYRASLGAKMSVVSKPSQLSSEKPILLRFADDREIAGNRPQLLNGAHTEARPRMIFAATIAGGIGFLGIAAAVLWHANALPLTPACWALASWFTAYAIWGGPAYRAMGALRRWTRLALLVVLCAGSALFTVASMAQMRLGSSAEAIASLVNGATLSVAGIIIGVAALLAAPALLSVATVGPAVAQRLVATIVFWCAVIAAAVHVALILALIVPESDTLSIIIAVAFPILGTLGAVIARGRSIARDLAVALDELSVQLQYPSSPGDLMRAFQSLERAARSGGTSLGRRRNHVIDEHIGITLAVAAAVLSKLPVHRSVKQLQAVLDEMTAFGIQLEPDSIRHETAALVTQLRIRLART